MIQRILIATILFFSLAACQKEETIPTIPGEGTAEGAVPISVSLSLKALTGVDYEPMRAGVAAQADEAIPRVLTSNKFKLMIAKKIDNMWILHKNDTITIDPSDAWDLNLNRVYDNETFFSFTTELTPGDYRMVIVTGLRSLNDERLKPGLIVGRADDNDDEFKVPRAFYNRKIDKGYLKPGEMALQEDIFTGYEDFTVEKTDDLHSASLVQEVPIQLDRKVSKFRILLHCEENPVSGFNYFDNYSCGIVAKLTTTAATPFCNGLNVWGEPYYDEGNPVTEMWYTAFAWDEKQAGNDGEEYLAGMKNSSRQLGVYFLSDPAIDIPISVSDIEVSASTQVNINYIYSSDEAGSFEPPISSVLKHNTISGIVLKPGEVDWRDPRYPNSNDRLRSMTYEPEKDVTTIFGPYHENKQK